MFADLQTEIADRIFTTQTYFKNVRKLRNDQTLRVAKGMLFVDLYAVYEYTIRTAVSAAITDLKAKLTPINFVRYELLGLILLPEMQGVVDAGRKTVWDKKLQLLRMIDSNLPMTTPDDQFPDDGSHFRVKQLQTIWDIFGITKPVVPHGRLVPLIGELVENRNNIAHGKERADEVGRRYSPRDMNIKIRRTERICLHIATTLQRHCARRSNYRR